MSITRTTRVALVKMIEEGLTLNEMAQALQVTTRSIDRALVKHGLRESKPAHLITPEELERAKLLASEGMPLTWIAEDLNRHASTIAKKLDGREKAVSEWREVWQYIRRRERLFELHHEFHPRERQTA